ncbi:MAG: class I SAM-dependent methyltransferase, partial [Candidatus Latescibacterota bacterium]
METAAEFDRSAETSLLFLQEAFGKLHPRNFAVRLWNGYEWGAEEGQEARFTLVLKHSGALRRMFLPLNEANLGAAYVHDDFDIEGEVESVFTLAEYLLSPPFKLTELGRLGWRLLNLPSNGNRRNRDTAPRLRGERHSRARDRDAVTYHYDTSNDFFSCFLDERMQYSCGYFQSARDTLEAAQEQKLDYVCRKLRIHPGDRVLDIGCGWGGLLI